MLGSVSRRPLVHNQMTCWTDAGRSVPFQSSKKPRFLERRTKCGGFRVATTTCGGQDAPRGVRRGDSNGSPQQSERVVPGPCESASAGSDPGDRRPWKALDPELTGRVARPVEIQAWQGPGVRTGSPVMCGEIPIAIGAFGLESGSRPWTVRPFRRAASSKSSPVHGHQRGSDPSA